MKKYQKEIKKQMHREISKCMIAFLSMLVLIFAPATPILDNYVFGWTKEEIAAMPVGTSLGTFHITGYCPCAECSEGYGTSTASGAVATPNRTVAVDPNLIPYGTVLEIDGRTYVAEDCGGAINGKDIDVYVATHEECFSDFCNGEKEVKIGDPNKVGQANSSSGDTSSSDSSEDEIEDLNIASLVKIVGDENTGYYYKFKSNTNAILQQIINENYSTFKNYNLSIKKLKEMIKANLATMLPDLGGAPYDQPHIQTEEEKEQEEAEDKVEYREVTADELKEDTDINPLLQPGSGKSSGSSGGGASVSSLDNFLFIGDSITNRLKYQGVVDAANVTIVSKGSTKASDWLSNNIKLDEDSSKGLNDSLKGHSGIKGINIMLGTNSCLLGSESSVNGIDDLKKIIEQLHQEYSNVPIFVDKLLPIGNGGQKNWTNYNNSLSNLGYSYVTVIDAAIPNTVEMDSNDSTKVHPSYEGAKTLWNNIKSQITGGTGTSSNGTSSSTSSAATSSGPLGAIGNQGLTWPVSTQTGADNRHDQITSFVGHRASPGGIGSTDHKGMDIACPSGTPIVATADGTVEVAGWYGGLGNAVVINHGLVDGKVIKSTYGHNESLAVSVGDTVKRGQVIAYADSTGNSTGPHCHFQIDVENQGILDPLSLLSSSEVTGGYWDGKITDDEINASSTSSAGTSQTMPTNLPGFITQKKANRYYDKDTFNGAVEFRRVTVNKNPGDMVRSFDGSQEKEYNKEEIENRGTIEEIPENVKKLLSETTLKENPNINLEEYAYLKIPYRNFNDDIAIGTMIAPKDIAEEIIDIFYDLYAMKYPIQNMQIPESYYQKDFYTTGRAALKERVAVLDAGGGSGSRNIAKVTGTSDMLKASQLDNNTICFFVGDEDHKNGMAIDLNPFINPKMNGDNPASETEQRFLKRDGSETLNEMEKAAMLTEDSDVVKLFTEKYGWEWLGDDENNPNYMCFKRPEKDESTEASDSISAKISEMLYVPEITFDNLITNNDNQGLNLFTLDSDNKVKIASWSWEDGKYNLTEGKTLNYRKAFQKYTMPFRLLMAVAINSQDGEFTEAFAKLGQDCQYIVAIEDIVTTTRTETSTVKTVIRNGSASSSSRDVTNKAQESVTQKAEITYVDGWYIKYSKDLNFATIPEGGIKILPGKITYTPPTQVSSNTSREAIDDSTSLETTITTTKETCKYEFNTGENEYITGNAEKFVEIYRNSQLYKAKRNMYPPWLTKMLEKNEITANLVDVMKYLCYQGKDEMNYGLSYLQFSEFGPDDLEGIGSGGTIYGDDFGDWDGTGTNEDFIELVGKYAVLDRDKNDSKIYPSVTIAQAIIESGWGRDNIALQYKNFFGMKAFSTTPNEFWSGERVLLNASEGGQSYFKVYDSLKNSVYDHGRNFRVTEVYSQHGVLDCIAQNLGPREQLKRIAESGYAVFADGTISTIDGVRYDEYLYNEFIVKYNLERFDRMKASDIVSSSTAGGRGAKVVEVAKKYEGTPYPAGGSSHWMDRDPPNTFDCQSYVEWVYREALGIEIGGSIATIRDNYLSKRVNSIEEAKPGDIICTFNMSSSATGRHIAIYAGDGKIWHANGTAVVLSNYTGWGEYILRAWE